MADKKKPNWIKIRTEFETTDVKLTELAIKHDVPYPTIRDRSRREEWKRNKDENRKEIVKKTSKKVIEKIADKNAYDIAIELEAANLINQLVLDALKDEKQFKRHIVQRKEKYSLGRINGYDDEGRPILVDEQQWVEEKELSVVDTKRLQAAAASLKTSAELKRLLLGIVDADKQEKIDIDKQKVDIDRQNLDIAKQKAGMNEDDDGLQTGVLILPDIDMALMDNAIVEETKVIDTGHTLEAQGSSQKEGESE